MTKSHFNFDFFLRNGWRFSGDAGLPGWVRGGSLSGVKFGWSARTKRLTERIGMEGTG